MTTPTNYPYSITEASTQTSEITTRLEILREMVVNLGVVGELTGETLVDDLLCEIDCSLDHMNSVYYFLQDAPDATDEYDDEYDDEDDKNVTPMSECVSKILEGHRLGYLSLPMGLVDELECALDECVM
jgi:hypothetical protein|tara:strand:- start:294 stop:680 length:387 start_codon:yes stop_codon:yes gene_type:complete